MSTSRKQDLDFNKMIGHELPQSFLQSCIDWIRDNMKPDEVFGLDNVVKFIADVKMPEGVFEKKELEQWAIENGFTPAPKKDSILSYAYPEAKQISE